LFGHFEIRTQRRLGYRLGSRRWKPRWFLGAVCLLLLLAAVGDAFTLRLQGVGTVNTLGSPYGINGETAEVTIDLDADNLAFFSSGANYRIFRPITTTPVRVVGAQSGVIAGIDPLRTVSVQSNQIYVENGTAATAVNYRSNCPTANCSGYGTLPDTANEFLELFGKPFETGSNWQKSSSSIVVAGGHNDAFLVGNIAWTLSSLDGGGYATILPTFDVQYTPGAASPISEGAAGIRVGGNTGDAEFPVVETIYEFPLVKIPSGVEVVSATLALNVNSVLDDPQIKVTGYPGDGAASAGDGTIAGTVLASGNPWPDEFSSELLLELDPAAVTSLLGTSTHLGLRLSSLDPFEWAWFNSIESSFPNAVPQLRIEYALAGLDGDFNDDSVVDAADYTTWRDGLGTIYTPADYGVWKANFGQVAGDSAAFATRPVPEPATAILFGLATVIALQRREHRCAG
jgi:hypothetical protein